MVFDIGENGIGPDACYEEVTALLSSPYSLDVDRVPFTIAIEEIGFHREDSKMGDETRDVRHTLQAEKFH